MFTPLVSKWDFFPNHDLHNGTGGPFMQVSEKNYFLYLSIITWPITICRFHADFSNYYSLSFVEIFKKISVNNERIFYCIWKGIYFIFFFWCFLLLHFAKKNVKNFCYTHDNTRVGKVYHVILQFSAFTKLQKLSTLGSNSEQIRHSFTSVTFL